MSHVHSFYSVVHALLFCMLTGTALSISQTTKFTSWPINVSYVLQGEDVTLQWEYSLSSTDDSKFHGVRWLAERGGGAGDIVLFTVGKDGTEYPGPSLGDFTGHVHNAGSSYSSRLASFKLSNVTDIHTKEKYICALFVDTGTNKYRSDPVYIKIGEKPTTRPTDSVTPTTPKEDMTGPIVGGVVGGVVLIGIIIGVVVYFKNKGPAQEGVSPE